MKLLLRTFVLAAVVCFSGSALAFQPGRIGTPSPNCSCDCTYTIGDRNRNGDLFYALLTASWNIPGGATVQTNWCNNAVRGSIASNFGMDGASWSNPGWGAGGGCSDLNTPHSRAVGAAAMLFMSAPDLDSRLNYLFGNRSLFINWIPWFVRSRLDNTQGWCDPPAANGACSNALADAIDADAGGRVRLFIRQGNACAEGFFQGSTAAPGQWGSIVSRAGILVHEARHVDGLPHDGTLNRDLAW
ncbi:MAG: hypothetical protein AAGA56_08425, partial [Myxococcota bacterium]